MAALVRALGVDAASAALEGGARLFESGFAGVRTRHLNFQAEGTEALGIIVGVEFDVGKNDAIATEAALEAKALGGGKDVVRRYFQSREG
jgi:hypothetical protein